MPDLLSAGIILWLLGEARVTPSDGSVWTVDDRMTHWVVALVGDSPKPILTLLDVPF